MPDTIDFIDTTATLTNAEIEEMEAAMFGTPSDEDWNMFLSDTATDPMEWEDR